MANDIVPFSELQQMANTMAKSGMFGKTPEQMLSLMMIAQAESLHPALAAMEYDIIQGRPALKGQAALARFQQAGGTVKWLIRTDKEAKAEFFHPQGGSLTVSWTMERAVKMNLDQKDNWKKQPGVMLSWRCVAEGVRAVFPACLNRMYLAEEVQDFEPLRTVSPDIEPEGFVKTAAVIAPTAAPKDESLDVIDWEKKAADLTEKAGIDKDMKAAIWKDCGKSAEAYCKKVEEILNAAPAVQNQEANGDDFQLENEAVPNVDTLIVQLEEFSAVENLPQSAKVEIMSALASNERDPKKLTDLLSKVRTAYKGN